MKVIIGLLVVVVVLVGYVIFQQESWHKQSARQLQREEEAREFKRKCQQLDLDISKHIMSVAECRNSDLNKYYRFKDATDELKQVVNGDLTAYLNDANQEAHIHAQWQLANDLLREMVTTYPDVTKESVSSATTVGH